MSRGVAALHGDQAARDADVGGILVAELQCSAEQFVVLAPDQPLVARLVEDVRDLLGGERRRELVLRLDPEEPDAAPGDSQSMRLMTGATTRETSTSTGTRATAARSGRAIEMFFGTISP